jgi:hypothetical protein
LVRYAGVFGPRSAWRKDIVPKPRVRPPACGGEAGDVAGEETEDTAETVRPRAKPKKDEGSSVPRADRPGVSAGAAQQAEGGVAGARMIKLAPDAAAIAARPGDVIMLTPNVLSVRHWDRLLDGALYAATPRVDWSHLLRRSFEVDVLSCAKCGGRLRVLAVIIEREPVRRILAHLGLPTEATPLARARDPTDDLDDEAPSDQRELGLA